MTRHFARILTFTGSTAAAIALAACSGVGTSTQPALPGNGGATMPAHIGFTSPTPTPIPLYIGETIGTKVFPDGDTTSGGQGQVVDGESCIGPVESVPYHHHIHIALFVNNQQIAIPRALGFVAPWKVLSNGWAYAPKCKYYMHAHDASGVIHLEYLQVPTTEPTLGEVFDVWGMPFSRSGVAGYNGTVTVFVNSIPYVYNPRTMGVGQNHIQITLEVNSTVTPPVYNWATY